MRSWLPILALLLVACDDEEIVEEEPETPTPEELPPCFVDDVPEAATLLYGWQDDGTFVGLGGRQVIPAGPTTVLPDMPVDVAVHPDGTVAYLALISRGDSSMAVLDLDSLEVIQVLEVSNTHPGLEVDPSGDRLYMAGGDSGTVEVIDIEEDRTLGERNSVQLEGTPSGLALSEDGQILWVGSYYESEVFGIDLLTLEVAHTFDIDSGAWDLAVVPGRDELYVSDLSGDGITVVDLTSGTVAAILTADMSPAGLAVSADGSRVFAAVSNGDVVAVIDTANREIEAELDVTEGDLLDEDGAPLLNSNVNAVWLDDGAGLLYAARGVDNAVSVIDADTLEVLGAFPVAFYPFDLEMTPDGALVVAEYKGGGIDLGSVTVVDTGSLDLEQTTAEVSRLFTTPADQFPMDCEGFFPIPQASGLETPIEHVVLVVKENKTFDCLFGDMGDELDVDADPEYQRWPSELTPNQRALMREFNVADNFHVNARESDSGHLYLTSGHMTHFVEWMFVETARNGGSLTWPMEAAAYPTVGNFFTHLLDHGKSIQIYGEIVGMFETSADGTQVMEYSDLDYPGGPFYSYGATDEERGAYVGEQIADDGLADFTFILFPNDHTAGTTPGLPTPESMVADNDRGVGVFIEALSQSDLWASTAVFVLQDDPQGCDDHVNDSRSPLFVISPYAKRGGYVSPTNSDYPSVFATIERILDVPPMGRADAAAAPLWDLFQPEPDLTPFDARDRVPPEINGADAFGSTLCAQMDFSGPDRSPELTPLLDAYMLWKMGRITRLEADRRLAAPQLALDDEDWEELEEEAEEETYAYDLAWERYVDWCEAKGLERPVRFDPRSR
jgi:DNA-binding beta-propeller fold protein YncE